MTALSRMAEIEQRVTEEALKYCSKKELQKVCETLGAMLGFLHVKCHIPSAVLSDLCAATLEVTDSMKDKSS